MKSYQFFTNDGRGGTMLCDDDTLECAVSELTKRFKGVIKVQYGSEVWEAPEPPIQNPESPPPEQIDP
ncbi:hypothetical protein [Motiliproteus sp. MSK22-1]|uniref:hypothetical protein n=1 Tax=Motiliproteus sp. MSK22-1 TaxID=1897630 RepID=UPI000976DB27|nr:hypothetical protein [Motiliproteus sp. MSK22-1]OMH25908.1 hypothetical protein BGP75_25705 [Motiliproteus sp. MSK22-1]